MIRLNKQQAERILRHQASLSEADQGDLTWIEKVERLSDLCEQGISKTHIAFLGTAMLAKALDWRFDLFAIKPKHAQGADRQNSFSARTLCHEVLVPLAAEFGIHLGVTGREPLNNQPYFRMTRLADGTPVHAGGREAFDYMVSLIRELQTVTEQARATDALRAFISVRRRYQPRYAGSEGEGAISPENLVEAIIAFVAEDSEGGRRAQAVVAGLLDVFAGVAPVETGRANTPRRRHPADPYARPQHNPH